MSPSVRVRPNSPDNTHHISLSGLGRTFGLKLERGAKSIIESPVSPSNIMKTGGVKKYGDFDPAFATIEMRTWEGGRGGEFLSDDPTKYYDGYGWTLSPGVWHQAPQWTWGEGYYGADLLMPGGKRRDVGNSVKWNALLSTNHIARSFVDQGTAHDMSRVQSWVRRIGTPPATLTVRVTTAATTAGGDGRIATSVGAGIATLESSACESLESFVWEAALTSIAAGDNTQTGTTTHNYWVELYTTAAGTDANHWEIGYNSSAAGNGSTSLKGDGTSGNWTASTVNFYLRVIPEPLRRKWHLFHMDRMLYAADEKEDGTTDMSIYMNGDRGLSTKTGGGGGTTAILYDAGKSWAANIFIGATVAIIRGTGAGQLAIVTGNASTSLDTTWAIAPGTDSEYVIYDTLEWTKLSSNIISSVGKKPVKDVTVGGDVAYFAFGASTMIGMLSWATSLHVADKSSVADSSIADFLDFFSDPVAGPQVYRAISSAGEVSRADLQNFSTLLTFSSGIACGGSGYPFTNLQDYNNQMHAFKEDSIWSIANDRSAKINVGLDAFASSNNGRAVATQNLFMYFGWSHSVERLGNGVVDDVGPWKGAGLKPGHQGPASVLTPVIAWTLEGVDAGTTGQSCMLAWNGRGWHEIYRVHSTGYRVENAIFQSNPGGRPRLWMSVGGDLVSMQFPKDTLNPRNDKEIHYQHEAVLETGIIDMDAVQLKKLFGKVYGVTKNLASSQARIYAEYQLDDDIASTQWTPLGSFIRSPIDNLNIRRGNKHALRMRYRGLTENSTVPTIMEAAVVKAVARTPVRRQWTIRSVTGDFQVDAQGLQDADPDDFYLWLQDVAVATEPILMRSAWEAMDNIYVFAEHPVLSREYTTPDGYWGGGLQMVIREIEE